MFNLMDYKQGEEIKERLDRLEKKMDAEFFEYGRLIGELHRDVDAMQKKMDIIISLTQRAFEEAFLPSPNDVRLIPEPTRKGHIILKDKLKKKGK